MRVIDVLNMGTANSSVLASLRPVLRDFIRNQLLGGREGNQAVSDAVNRINAELRPLIESIVSHYLIINLFGLQILSLTKKSIICFPMFCSVPKKIFHLEMM